MNPCRTLAGDFCDSVRPSSRWVLLTRFLFATCGGSGQQTRGASPSQAEFSLTARLLISSGARDATSLGKTVFTLQHGGDRCPIPCGWESIPTAKRTRCV